MHQFRSLRCLATALTISFSTAVTLSDFAPEAVSLTPNCNYIYHNTNIQGCTPADFTSGAACSQPCIQGLALLNPLIVQQCQGNSQNEQFIIAAFLNGNGIQSLCPNVAVIFTPSGSPTATMATPTPSSYTSANSGAGSGSTITSGTVTEPSPTHGASSNSGLIIDTSSSPQPSSMATSSVPLTISPSQSGSSSVSSFVTSFKPTSLIIPTTSTSQVPGATGGPLFASLSSASSSAGATSSAAACIEQGGTLFSMCNSAASLTGSKASVWIGLSAATISILSSLLLF